MAVRLEFINLVIPIATIEAKYPGGWPQCLEDHAGAIGHRVWYDDHLFRDGAMSPFDMHMLLLDWTELGFRRFGRQKGQRIWKDMCVVDGFVGPTLPCPWVEVDLERQCAHLAGAISGNVIGPSHFALATQ